MSKAQEESAASGSTLELSEFDRLLDKSFQPKTDEAKGAVRSAVAVLAEEALKGTSVRQQDSITYIQAVIAEIDRKLSKQLNLILHHEELTKLEGSWRGLHRLVYNTESGTDLKIRVMNVSKKDLHRALRSYGGANWDQSPLFKKIYEEEFGTPGGEPYGTIIGDFEFDHTAPDVELLRNLSKIAAAAHAPFIAAASPKLMNMDTWQELMNPRDLAKLLDNAEYAGWKSLRESEDSRFIGLAMPRYLARLPYSTKNNPIDAFAFEEDASTSDHHNFVWANAAYAMATNITRAFKLHGWCAQIRGVESGGLVDNLPVHNFPTDDGGVDMKCPTEIAITDRREHELARLGMMPLSHWKNTDFAAFIGAQSLQKPAKYDDKDATANANLSARLPYLFATCRFAHFLKCIVRDKIGSFKERDDMVKWLNDWIMQYVADSNVSEEMKARYPLSGAQVEVQADPENPGYYRAQFYLRPHFQLEGVNVSLRLVSRLPSEKKAS
ncbi:MAG TPA: type VI secretion system contractile sheath large subunit [Verrucomicrobiales bacterium]|jgi:type VI secretion system protein ImpC|nr:type VI secretion system contractile sheath large subunit [Verrucomicrobiales bacterium]